MLYINAHQMRMEQWDDILANHARHVLAPHMKKGKRSRVEDFKLYPPRGEANDQPEEEPTPDELEEARERRERMRERMRERGVPATLKKRYGDGVKIRDLT